MTKKKPVKTKPKEEIEEVGEELTLKQERFCQEFLIDLNGTKAAERSGYKKNSAAQQASRLLTNDKISQRIFELKQKRAERTESDADRVVRELKALGFSNIKDVASWDEEGHMTVVPSEQMPDEVAASIESIKMVKTTLMTNDDGEQTLQTTLSVKMHRKTPNILLLMKHIGMLGEKDDEENPILKKAFADLKRRG